MLPVILISIRPSDEQPAFLNVKGFLSNIPTQNCLLWKSKGNVLLSKEATFIKQSLVFFTLLNSEIYNQLFPIMIGYKGQAGTPPCLQERALQPRRRGSQRRVAGELSVLAPAPGSAIHLLEEYRHRSLQGSASRLINNSYADTASETARVTQAKSLISSQGIARWGIRGSMPKACGWHTAWGHLWNPIWSVGLQWDEDAALGRPLLTSFPAKPPWNEEMSPCLRIMPMNSSIK